MQIIVSTMGYKGAGVKPAVAVVEMQPDVDDKEMIDFMEDKLSELFCKVFNDESLCINFYDNNGEPIQPLKAK